MLLPRMKRAPWGMGRDKHQFESKQNGVARAVVCEDAAFASTADRNHGSVEKLKAALAPIPGAGRLRAGPGTATRQTCVESENNETNAEDKNPGAKKERNRWRIFW